MAPSLHLQSVGRPMHHQPSSAVTPDAAVRVEETAQLRRLEACSALEATTLVALVAVAVPLEHIAGWPQGVRILGPVHGLVFLFYCWTVVQTVAGGGWRRTEILRLFAVAFIPLAGYHNIGWIRRSRDLLDRSEPCS